VPAGHRFTVVFQINAPTSGPPVTLAPVAGGARYDPPTERERATLAALGERVFAPVPFPFRSANTTNYPASFGVSGAAVAVRASGKGVFVPVNAPQTDSYAALYEAGRAGPSSAAQVTVTSDPAGGIAGGAGLIERNAMRAPRGSAAGVVLFVTGSATIEMAWNAFGGRDVDSRYQVPGVLVGAPVSLRLVRSGNTYTGYYSTDQGLTWSVVNTVTVAPAAAAAAQDVGIFHASGLPMWTTTATFKDLLVR
jgi:hypothetical protein